MTGLEQTFYIMGIVFMSLCFVFMIAIVVAIFTIRARINRIHDRIEERVDYLTTLAERSGELTSLASKTVLKQAKKVLKKKK
jgi:cell division protein FtsL